MAKAIASKSTAAQRRAEIKRQWALVCPKPMAPEALERAASTIERLQDEDVDAVVSEALRLHNEAKICRGE